MNEIYTIKFFDSSERDDEPFYAHMSRELTEYEKSRVMMAFTEAIQERDWDYDSVYNAVVKVLDDLDIYVYSEQDMEFDFNV